MLFCTIFGIAGVICAFVQFSFMMRMRTKCALFWVAMELFVLGLAMFIMAVTSMGGRTGIVSAGMSVTANSVCKVAWDNKIKNCSDPQHIETDRGEQCCHFLSKSLENDLCAPNLPDITITGMMRNRFDDLIHPLSLIVLFISIYTLYLCICEILYLINQKEWKEKDEQEALMKKGGILTEEDLARLNRPPDIPLGYYPTRGGNSTYVKGFTQLFLLFFNYSSVYLSPSLLHTTNTDRLGQPDPADARKAEEEKETEMKEKEIEKEKAKEEKKKEQEAAAQNQNQAKIVTRRDPEEEEEEEEEEENPAFIGPGAETFF